MLVRGTSISVAGLDKNAEFLLSKLVDNGPAAFGHQAVESSRSFIEPGSALKRLRLVVSGLAAFGR
jgi:hypothetical protein